MTSTLTQPPSAVPPSLIGDDDTGWEFITPTQAAAYLGLNKSNRHKRPGVITAYASDMTFGRWQQTHMAVAFDTDGELIDGQHRLEAIVKSGTGQHILVVRNVPKAAQEVIDANAARSASDALKLSHRVDKNHPVVAAAARTYILWAEGHHRLVRPSVNGARKVTNSEITALVDEQQALPTGAFTLMDAVAEGVKWHTVGNLMSPSTTSFAFWLLGSTDYNEALDFFNSLDDLAFVDDPTKQLYERLNLAKQHKESLRISQNLWFVVTAWNAVREGTANGTAPALATPFVKSLAGGKMKGYNPPEKVKGGIKTYPLVPDPE